MQSQRELISLVTQEIADCLQTLSAEQIEEGIAAIFDARRLFLAGAGRSGLAMRAFAMRLMHLGKTVYMVGDVTTPSVNEGDLVIIGSGSGSTGNLQVVAKQAIKAGARVLLITIMPDSPIGRLADLVIRIPAPSIKAEEATGTMHSIQPMGSLFEQSLFVLGDVLILLLMQKHEIGAKEMFARHANLE